MEKELMDEKTVICGTCGEKIEYIDEEFICRTCEHYFLVSSKVIKCSKCLKEFGSYKRIDEEAVSLAVSNGYYHKHTNIEKYLGLCPSCRLNKNNYYGVRNINHQLFSTTKELIRHLFDERLVEKGDFTISEDFLRFCLDQC